MIWKEIGSAVANGFHLRAILSSSGAEAARATPLCLIRPRAKICFHESEPLFLQRILTAALRVWKETLWFVVKCTFFQTPWPIPSVFRAKLLRLFGCERGGRKS